MFRPAKQRLPAVLLQQSNLMADRGRGNAELIGRALEAQTPRGGFESPQFAKRWQMPHGKIIDELNSSLPEFFDFASKLKFAAQFLAMKMAGYAFEGGGSRRNSERKHHEQ